MDYKAIDIKFALDQLGGSDQLYKIIVTGFYDRYREVNHTIENHLKNGEAEEARRLSHSIKGLCGNLGAMKLRERALDLELAIKSNVSDQQGYLDAFTEELINVVEDVTRIIENRYGTEDKTSMHQVTVSTPFNSKCRNLSTALRTYRTSEVKVAKENLSRSQIPEHFQEDIGAVMQLIELFEYDLAIERLEKVCG